MRVTICGGPVFTGLGEHLERDLAILVEDDKIEALCTPTQLIQMALEAHETDVKSESRASLRTLCAGPYG
jgi:hypothetical protein